MKIIAELSKENIDISIAEIVHFLNLKDYEIIDNYILFDTKTTDLSRLAYTKKIFRVVTIFHKISDLNGIFSEFSGSFYVDGNCKSNIKKYAKIIWNQISSPSVDCGTPKYLFFFFEARSLTYCTLLLSENHYKKPKFVENLPISLSPRLTKACINMTRSKKIIFDPFVGTGTTMIEASRMGLYPIGYDNDYRMIILTRKNLKSHKITNYSLQLLNSTKINFSMDYIFCDLPYSRNTKSFNNLDNFLDVLNANLIKRAVVILNDDSIKTKIDMLPNLKIIETLSKYVHSKLTRYIFIIEKIINK